MAFLAECRRVLGHFREVAYSLASLEPKRKHQQDVGHAKPGTEWREQSLCPEGSAPAWRLGLAKRKAAPKPLMSPDAPTGEITERHATAKKCLKCCHAENSGHSWWWQWASPDCGLDSLQQGIRKLWQLVIRPNDEIVLARVEVSFLKLIMAAEPDDGQPKSHS